MNHLLTRLNELYATVHLPSVGFAAIDSLVAEVAALSKAQVREVASAFGLRTLANWGKQRLLAEIQRKLYEQKGSAIRIAVI